MCLHVMRPIIIKPARTYRSTRMRRSLALSRLLAASFHDQSWADCIIIMSGFSFRQGHPGVTVVIEFEATRVQVQKRNKFGLASRPLPGRAVDLLLGGRETGLRSGTRTARRLRQQKTPVVPPPGFACQPVLGTGAGDNRLTGSENNSAPTRQPVPCDRMPPGGQSRSDDVSPRTRISLNLR